MLSHRLKLLKYILNISQKDFSEKISIKLSTYKSYEANNSQISIPVAIKIAEISKCNLMWFIKGEGNIFEDEEIYRNYILEHVNKITTELFSFGFKDNGNNYDDFRRVSCFIFYLICRDIIRDGSIAKTGLIISWQKNSIKRDIEQLLQSFENDKKSDYDEYGDAVTMFLKNKILAEKLKKTGRLIRYIKKPIRTNNQNQEHLKTLEQVDYIYNLINYNLDSNNSPRTINNKKTYVLGDAFKANMRNQIRNIKQDPLHDLRKQIKEIENKPKSEYPHIPSSADYNLHESVEVPLMGEIACGEPAENLYWQNETIGVPKSLMKGDLSSYHVLVANGKSMEPLILHKDKLLLKLCNNWKLAENQVVAAMIDGKITLKKLEIHHEEKISILKTFNSDYKDIILTEEKALDITLIGILKALLRLY